MNKCDDVSTNVLTHQQVKLVQVGHDDCTSPVCLRYIISLRPRATVCTAGRAKRAGADWSDAMRVEAVKEYAPTQQVRGVGVAGYDANSSPSRCGRGLVHFPPCLPSPLQTPPLSQGASSFVINVPLQLSPSSPFQAQL